MLAKLLTAAAVASMVAAPVFAAPASPAGKLSLSRIATVSKKKSNLHGAAIVGVLATLAVVGGTVAITSNSNKPKSP